MLQFHSLINFHGNSRRQSSPRSSQLLLLLAGLWAWSPLTLPKPKPKPQLAAPTAALSVSPEPFILPHSWLACQQTFAQHNSEGAWHRGNHQSLIPAQLSHYCTLLLTGSAPHTSSKRIFWYSFILHCGDVLPAPILLSAILMEVNLQSPGFGGWPQTAQSRLSPCKFIREL